MAMRAGGAPISALGCAGSPAGSSRRATRTKLTAVRSSPVLLAQADYRLSGRHEECPGTAHRDGSGHGGFERRRAWPSGALLASRSLMTATPITRLRGVLPLLSSLLGPPGSACQPP